MKPAVLLAIFLPPLAASSAFAADWPIWGGTPQRNMVNTVEKNIPAAWDVTTGRNIKWIARLGSQSFGNPVVAGGKIFVGTNNQARRQPGVKGDRGVVVCFREADGAFLWQIVHDKLASGRVNDWPMQGVCSTCTWMAAASITSATAANWSAPTSKAPATATAAARSCGSST